MSCLFNLVQVQKKIIFKTTVNLQTEEHMFQKVSHTFHVKSISFQCRKTDVPIINGGKNVIL